MANASTTNPIGERGMLLAYRNEIDGYKSYLKDFCKPGPRFSETETHYLEGYIHAIGFCLGYKYQFIQAELNEVRAELGYELLRSYVQ